MIHTTVPLQPFLSVFGSSRVLMVEPSWYTEVPHPEITGTEFYHDLVDRWLTPTLAELQAGSTTDQIAEFRELKLTMVGALGAAGFCYLLNNYAGAHCGRLVWGMSPESFRIHLTNWFAAPVMATYQHDMEQLPTFGKVKQHLLATVEAEVLPWLARCDKMCYDIDRLMDMTLKVTAALRRCHQLRLAE